LVCSVNLSLSAQRSLNSRKFFPFLFAFNEMNIHKLFLETYYAKGKTGVIHGEQRMAIFGTPFKCVGEVNGANDFVQQKT